MELNERHDVLAGGNGSVAALPTYGIESPSEAGAAQPDLPTGRSLVELVSPPLTPERIRHYTELDGGEGRGVFYRPHRFSAEDLAPLRACVTVTVAGARNDLPLQDVSQSGVAVVWPPELPLQRHQRLPLVVRFDNHVAFRGEARVGSIRQGDGCTVVGLSFGDFLLDVEELQELRNVRAWAADQGLTRQAQTWELAGGDRFKALVSELRLFFEDARVHLDALERDLPWRVLHGQGHPARAALISSVRKEFADPVIRLSERLDEAVRELPGGHANPAAQAWSKREVHEFFMASPGGFRCWKKPFGYPGDYEVMNFLYANHFEGTSLFSRAVTLSICNVITGYAVRYRKDLVKRELAALLQRRSGSGTPVRVLSIAAGPAQELWELLSEMDELPVPIEVVLFEQDKNALAQAWRRLHSVVEARFPGRVTLTFLHDSIKRLLRDGDLFTPFGRFDLVYSCGLYDYLAQSTATILTRRLAASTRPGGQLLVANMVDNPARWLLEHQLDWHLVYRTHEQLLDVGRRAVPTAQVRLLEEESRVNPFFELVPG
jgi:extracellular factor (EF) 3-hydroxypalmitic acid methyl ester biosynthesis protein